MPVQCTCLTCGATFDRYPSQIALGKGKFCKRTCYVAARRGTDFSSGLKTCPTCRIVLPHASFFRRSATPSGLSSTCKACHTAETKSWRKQRPGYTTEWARAKYGSLPRTKLSAEEAKRRILQSARKTYRKDLKRSRERALARYYRERDRRRAYSLEYGRKNRERRALIGRLWAINNPLKVRVKQHRRRVAVLAAPGVCTAVQLEARCTYYGWLCYLCQIPLTMKTLTIDHRIPLARGGSQWPANLAPCCRRCNGSKGGKTETEYRAWQATLHHSA